MGTKNLIGIIALVAIVLTSYFVRHPYSDTNETYNLKVMHIQEGWGYEVYFKDQLLIKQHQIPGIDSKKSFMTKNDAEKIGFLVMKKLNRKESPSVSKEDLKRVGIEF